MWGLLPSSQKYNWKPRYGLAFLLAALFHTLIWSVLFLNFNFYKAKPVFVPGEATIQPMEAVALDAAEVNKRVAAIKAREARKKERALELQKAEQQKLAQAKLEREQEEKKIAELKAKQAEVLKAIEIAKKEEKEKEEKKLKLAELKKAEEAQAKAHKKKVPENSENPKHTTETPSPQKVNSGSKGEMGLLSEMERYKRMIENKIENNWNFAFSAHQKLKCRLFVKILPGGDVAFAKVVDSSGDPAFDESAVRAVYKASPLPLPPDPRLFADFRELNIPFNPYNL